MNCTCHSHGGFVLKRGPSGPAQQLSLEGLAPRGGNGYLDRVGSVSALIEIEDDFEYDANHVELNRRLIHNGP